MVEFNWKKTIRMITHLAKHHWFFLVIFHHLTEYRCKVKNWVSILPDYSDLILLNEPWSCFGLFTSLFIHQADESFDRDLNHYKGCKSVSNTWPISHLLGHRLKMHDAAEAGAHNRLQVQHHNLNIYAIYKTNSKEFCSFSPNIFRIPGHRKLFQF